MIIRRKGCGLDDKHILPPHIFLDLNKDLHIRKAAHLGFDERHREMIADCFGERCIGIAGNELDVQGHRCVFILCGGKPFRAYRS